MRLGSSRARKHDQKRSIHPREIPLSRHGIFRASSSAGVFAPREHAHWSPFCLAAVLSNFTAGGTASFFWDPRALPTLIIGKETVSSRDLWNLNLHLRVCSSKARGGNPLALEAQSWLAPQAHLALWLLESSCVCPIKSSRLRLFSPPPKKLHAPQAQDVAGFGMFPPLKRLAQSDSSTVSTVTSCRRVLQDTGPQVRPAGVPHTSFSGGTTPQKKQPSPASCTLAT